MLVELVIVIFLACLLYGSAFYIHYSIMSYLIRMGLITEDEAITISLGMIDELIRGEIN